jgi:hypothetical protein
MTFSEQEFWNEYVELASEVLASSYQFFELNLRRWFEVVDREPAIAAIINRLEAAVDFDSWYDQGLKTRGGMVGSGRLQWPSDQATRIGLQLNLFRRFADEKLDPKDFAINFLYSDNNFNVMVRDVSLQVFQPMIGDLRRYVGRELTARRQVATGEVPASDRVVRLDHNQAKVAADAIEEVERAIEQTNEYPDPDDKSQTLAELGAARRLLKATQVRVEKLAMLAVPALKHVMKLFLDTAIATIAGAALALVWEIIKAAF